MLSLTGDALLLTALFVAGTYATVRLLDALARR